MVVQRVVEAVATHVVGGFEDPGESDIGGGHHQRRQRLPLHVGGQAHRGSGADPGERVGVEGLGDDEVGGQAGQPLGEPTVVVIHRRQRERQHADSIRAVQHRQVQPHRPIGQLLLDAGIGGEGTPGPASVDRSRPTDQAPPGQRLQGPLVVVLQPDTHIGAADSGDLLGHERSHQACGHQVGPIEQGAQHALSETLDPGPAGRVREALARSRERCLHRAVGVGELRRPARALLPGPATSRVAGRRPSSPARRRSGAIS